MKLALLSPVLCLMICRAIAADALTVTMSPASIVVQREGITGAGQVVMDGSRRITVHYPNHPDDFGGSGGTGASFSSDGGLTWTQGSDDWPMPKMVDLWQDRLRSGEVIAFGLRWTPDPKKRGEITAEDVPGDAYAIAMTKDRGRTWTAETAVIECPPALGVIARPLPHLFEDDRGTMFMPAYAWGRHGTGALLLQSTDHGRHWSVTSAITTAAAIVKSGTAVTTPWLEATVTRVRDGSLLAIIRTGSSAQSALVSSRSTDHGRTWSPVEKLLAGPQHRIVAGKLPTLEQLPNGVLALLTAHTRNHCRLYFSTDGAGRAWSEGRIITSQSGGNAGMTHLDDHSLLVITPANGRIDSWRVTVKPGSPVSSGVPGPINIAFSKGRLSWTAPAEAANIVRYQITPVFLKPSAGNKDAEIHPCVPVQTRDAATQLELGRMLSIGGSYRFEVAAVDREGRVSSASSSGEVVVGP